MFSSFRLMTSRIYWVHEVCIWLACVAIVSVGLGSKERPNNSIFDVVVLSDVHVLCENWGESQKKETALAPLFARAKHHKFLFLGISLLLNLKGTLATQASIRAKWPVRPELILVSVAWSDKPLLTFEVLSTIIYTIQQTYFKLHQLTPSSKADYRMTTVIFHPTLQASEIASFLPKFNLRVFRRSEIVNLVHPLKVWYWQRFAVGLFRQIIKTNFIRGKQQLTLSF